MITSRQKGQRATKTLGPFNEPAHGRGIVTRLTARLLLLQRWVVATIIPQYGWLTAKAMILIIFGNISEAISFVAAAKLISHSLSTTIRSEPLLQDPLVIGSAVILAVLITGSFTAYRGHQLAIRTALDYESASFAHAIDIARRQLEAGKELQKEERHELIMQAPRFMARAMLQLVNCATSAVLAIIGFGVCVFLYPGLTILIMLILAVSSPFYIVASINSTNIGHELRRSAKNFSKTKKELSEKWFSEEYFNLAQVYREARESESYTTFLDAYGNRLVLSPRIRLLSNMIFATCLLSVFLWVGLEHELSVDVISGFIAYLVFMRVFFSSLTAIFSAVQSLNIFTPYFLKYLMLDARLEQLHE